MTNAEKILTRGLKDGYAGGKSPVSVVRGSISGKETHETYPEFDAEYVDQWFFKRTGAGQDIARIGNEITTRAFAGGIVDSSVLSSLHINEQDVLSYHKKKLSEVVDVTRLHASVEPAADGDWQYKYLVVKEYPNVPLSIGVETITFKEKEVFVHVFLITPMA